MRRAGLLLLIVVALIIDGCSSAPFVNPQPQSSTSVPAAVEQPTSIPTNTSAPIPTFIPPATETTAPAQTTSAPTTAPTRVPTSAPAGGSTTVAPGGVVTFQSQRLGIRFNYLSKQESQGFAALESGDKVYVYVTNVAPTEGQWVQVFSKAPSQSLQDAIKAQVLKGYSLQDCLVTEIANPNVGFKAPSSYRFAGISLPIAANDTPETIQAKAAKCPQPYAAVGGLAYFLADIDHPNKFVFFSIGQYYIPAANNQPWQATLQFLDNASSGGTTTTYLDDRSSVQSILNSFVNALNRKEYVRAYSYWEPDAAASELAPFDQFQRGYANTASVQLTLGTSGVGVAAGNIYYTIPVAMLTQTATGEAQTFVGCYLAHQGQPANFGAPPFQPLGIQKAKVKQVANNASTSALLATICADLGFEPGSGAAPQPTFAPGDISAARYLDDRSDPVQVLRSLLNAINRHEYVRAYYYWEPNSPQLLPYNQFEQGYANTASVQATFGTVIPDAGAGQFYYSVPATLIAKTTGGATQAFVGCYILHLSNPGIQGVPPFQPLSIRQAKVSQVDSNANTAALMAQACQP